MIRSLSYKLAGGVALMAALTACGDEPTSPSLGSDAELATFDVAAVAGDQTHEDVAMMRHHQGMMGVILNPQPRFGVWQANCTYDPSSEKFVCPDRTNGSLTIKRFYEVFDASGNNQSAYDAQTTASARFHTVAEGSRTGEHFTATVLAERDFTVSGLAGSETTHTWNGSAVSTHTRSRHADNGFTRSYSHQANTAVNSVVVPFPHQDGLWPLSGTITRTVTFNREAGPRPSIQGTRTATVTFNGTQLVPLTVNGVTFTLDLATGKIVRD